MKTDVERVALAMATVIAKRHGHEPEYWLNDERREEARAALAAIPSADGLRETLSEALQFVEEMESRFNRHFLIGGKLSEALSALASKGVE